MKWLKQCTKCGEEKPIEAFSRNAASKTGYRPACKVCDRAGINKQGRRAYEKKYWSGAKGSEKKARIKQCREKKLEAYTAVLQAYRKTDTFKARHRAHAATRRARMRDAFIEAVDYQTIYEVSSKTCVYCGKPLDFEEVEFDHFIPIAKGGRHERSNIRVSCLRCNRVKGARLVAEVCYQVV